jgi:hypothetical protein
MDTDVVDVVDAVDAVDAVDKAEKGTGGGAKSGCIISGLVRSSSLLWLFKPRPYHIPPMVTTLNNYIKQLH